MRKLHDADVDMDVCRARKWRLCGSTVPTQNVARIDRRARRHLANPSVCSIKVSSLYLVPSGLRALDFQDAAVFFYFLS